MKKTLLTLIAVTSFAVAGFANAGIVISGGDAEYKYHHDFDGSITSATFGYGLVEANDTSKPTVSVTLTEPNTQNVVIVNFTDKDVVAGLALINATGKHMNVKYSEVNSVYQVKAYTLFDK